MAVSDVQPLSPTAPVLRRHALERGLAAAGALVCVCAVALAAAGAADDAAFGRGLLELLIVGVPIAVGLYALRAPMNASFGIALLAVGFGWSLTALTESAYSIPYTIGRLTTWLIFPCVVYLLLAFPHGRIERGVDRWVFGGVVAVMAFLFFGTVPMVQAFPPKTLWGTCTTDCPANALFALDAQPALLTNVIYVREWLVELLWLGIFFSMYRRWRAASPLQRRAMTPAFLAGLLLGLCHFAHITARQLGAPADTVIGLSSLWTFCIVLVCLGFLCGLLWRRTLVAQSLARLSVELHAGRDRAQMRDALATALRDPTADVDDARGAALVHDPVLLDDPELLAGVSRALRAAMQHERLTADLGQALTALEDSRRRIAEAADLERARIERDLHDGAQQRLIVLGIRLGIAEESLKTDPEAGAALVQQLGFELEAALEELRSLAHGVYPSLLTDRGVLDALRSIAAQAPLPVHVIAQHATRQPINVESAAYFTCVEALQNALKHAHGATGLWITLTQTRTRLRFEVRDDGPGFVASATDGRGLQNMHDRVEAIGGDLTIDSRPGRGTTVTGSIPMA